MQWYVVRSNTFHVLSLTSACTIDFTKHNALFYEVYKKVDRLREPGKAIAMLGNLWDTSSKFFKLALHKAVQGLKISGIWLFKVIKEG